MTMARPTLYSPLLTVMVGAAQKAARGLVRDFGEIEHLQVSRKGLGDFVSTADHRSERILVQELQRARPGYGFLLEESGEIKGQDSSYRWIIDPLDGTTNFLHGIPHFAISIGLQYKEEIVAAIVYNPIADELFWAEKGKGAFMNQRRLRVSGRQRLEEALLATGIPFGSHGNRDNFIKMLNQIMPLVAGIRRFGAATLDLAYVASGRYEGYFETDCAPWDIATGILLVQEAGGYVSEIEGGRNMLQTGSILATNAQLFDPLGSLLRQSLSLEAQKKKTSS